MNSTLHSIHMIITDMTADRQESILWHRMSTSRLMLFVGELSKVVFGTATENDLINQKVGIDHVLRVGKTFTWEIQYIGDTLKRAMVIYKANMVFNLKLILANTGGL